MLPDFYQGVVASFVAVRMSIDSTDHPYLPHNSRISGRDN